MFFKKFFFRYSASLFNLKKMKEHLFTEPYQWQILARFGACNFPSFLGGLGINDKIGDRIFYTETGMSGITSEARNLGYFFEKIMCRPFKIGFEFELTKNYCVSESSQA